MVESPPCGWSPTSDGWNPTTGGWSPTTGERTPLRDYNRPAGRRNEAIGDYGIRILRHLAMRLKERRRQKKQQEGAKRNEIVGVWKIKFGVWEW
jgi:hypothetical protein